MSEKITVHATVVVSVKIPARAWSAGCTIEQVYRQAKEEAIGRVENAFCGQEIEASNFEVTAVIVPEKKG